MKNNDTIFALSTLYGKSGVAVVRLSGKKSLEILKKVFKKYGDKKTDFKPRYSYFGTFFDPETKDEIDKCLVVYFKAPKSWTGEDTVEISLHGSKAVINKVLDVLSSVCGIRMAEPGEFTKRAFLNDKMDLTEVEGLADLIDSETEKQRKQALSQMNGSLSFVYDKWRKILLEILSSVEASIDFSEDEIPDDLDAKMRKEIKKLAENIQDNLKDARGEKLRSGLNVSIIGVPNVGKSSLFNYILKEDRAIVTETAGTTRDIIEAYIDVKCFPVNLFDTAGIRTSKEKIEAEGIKRAIKKAEDADLKILVAGSEKEIFFNKTIIDENTIIILNKIDEKLFDLKSIKNKLSNFKYIDLVQTSITKRKNLDIFMKTFEDAIVLKMDTENPIITQKRHRVCLENTVNFLINSLKQKQTDLFAEDVRLAAEEMGKLLGKIRVDELLDQIFSSFCIGK